MLRVKTYNYRIVYHPVTEGQTWWGICGRYFYQQDRYGRNDFGEFVYNTRSLNKADKRALQVGEVVKIKLEYEVK